MSACDAPVLVQEPGGLLDPREADAGGEQLHLRAVAVGGGDPVQAAQDALDVDVVGLLGLRDRLVVDGEVEDHVLAVRVAVGRRTSAPGRTA